MPHNATRFLFAGGKSAVSLRKRDRSTREVPVPAAHLLLPISCYMGTDDALARKPGSRQGR